jgi:hypothetical protein
MSASSNCESEVPSLSVVVPRQKVALNESECAVFEGCLSSNPEEIASSLQIFSPLPRAYVIDGVLTKAECDSLIQEIDSNSALSFWCAGNENNPDTKSFRNVKTIEIYSDCFAEMLWQRIRYIIEEKLDINLDDEEDEEFERELKGKWIPCGTNPDSLFARYPSYGSFAPHTDGRAIVDFNKRSHYSIILYLNSVPIKHGAGTRFYHSTVLNNLTKQEVYDNVNNNSNDINIAEEDSYGMIWTGEEAYHIGEVEAVAGRMLIFHQSLVHEGIRPLPPYLKYIIRSDIISQRIAPICDSEVDQEAYRIYREAEHLAEQGDLNQATILFRKAFKMSPLMAQIMGQA